ncbi:40S ribosomal protein S15, partial [Biomphalaria glabrata]
MFMDQFADLFNVGQRRRLNRALKCRPLALMKRLRKAKKEAGLLERTEVSKTHLRDMIIIPEMLGSIVGVYNGKTFNQVEIRPEMVGHYLGESCTSDL